MSGAGRRWLRRIAWVLGASLAAVIVLACAALLALQTDWGREQVRRRVEAELTSRIRGSLEVERLEGDLLGRFAARGITVRDKRGAVVVSVGRLVVDYRLLPLVHRHVHADQVLVAGLEVNGYRGPHGRLTLADLWIHQPPGEPSAPWTATIDELRVDRSLLAIERAPGTWERVGALSLEASIRLRTDSVDVSLVRLRGRWAEPGIGLAARGQVHLATGGTSRVTDLVLAAGGSRIHVSQAGWTGATGHVAASVIVEPGDLRRMVPGSRLRRRVQAAVFLGRGGATPAISAQIAGRAGSAAFSIVGRAIPADRRGSPGVRGGQLALFVSRLRPHELWAGAARAELDGWIRAEASELTSLARADAEVEGELRGAVKGVAVERVWLEGSLADQVVRLAVHGRAPGARAELDARARLPAGSPLDDPGRIEIERSHLVVDVDDVARVLERAGVAPDRRPAGPLRLRARASGRLAALSGHASLSSDELRWRGFAMEGLRGAVRLVHAGDEPAGRAELTASSIAHGGTSYGGARVTAELRPDGPSLALAFRAGGRSGVSASGSLVARRVADGVRVAVGRLALRTRGLLWRAEDGVVAVTEGGRRIDADLGLSSSGGRIAVGAHLDRTAGALRGRVQVRLERLRPARVGRALGGDRLADLPRGQVSARIDARLPAGPAELTVSVERLRWPESGPGASGVGLVTGTLHASVRDRRATAQLELAGATGGRLHARLTGRAPARLLDGRRWQALGAGDVESVLVRLGRIDLERLLGERGGPVRGGIVDATLTAGEGLASGSLDARLERGQAVHGAGPTIPVDANVSARLAGRALTLEAFARSEGYGRVDVAADLRIPRRPLEARAWRAAGPASIRAARIGLRSVRLRAVRSLLAPSTRQSDGAGGLLEATLTVGAAARTAELRAEVRQARLRDRAAPVGASLVVSATRREAKIQADVRVAERPAITASATVGAGTAVVDRLMGAGPSAAARALRGASVRADVVIARQPVTAIAHALGARPDLAGSVHGEASIRGTLAAPRVRASISAPGLVANGVRFEQLGGTGVYEGGPWSGTLRARTGGGGRLIIDASGRALEAEASRLRLSARRLRLAPFAPLWQRPGGTVRHLDGTLEAELTVAGGASAPTVDGWLRVRGGSARVASFLRPIHAASVDVRADGGRVTVELSARSRPGEIRGSLSADVRRPAASRFTAHLRAEELPLSVGQQIVSVNGQLRADGRLRERTLEVDATIVRGLIVRVPNQRGIRLHDTGPLEDVVYVDAKGAAAALARAEVTPGPGFGLRVRVRTEDHVTVRADIARLEVAADLQLTSRAGQTRVVGTLDARRGRVEVSGRQFEIERGGLVFEGQRPPDPWLDVRLSHRYPEATVHVEVTGPLSDPRVRFLSDSGRHDQGQLLGMVLGGGPGGGPRSTAGERALGVAASAIASRAASAVRRAGLPVDTIKVGTDAASDQVVSSLTVGKWLTDRLFMAIRHRFVGDDAVANRNEVVFQHYLAPAWMWEGVVGDRGSTSIDLLWMALAR